jgi:hypothetical protein
MKKTVFILMAAGAMLISAIPAGAQQTIKAGGKNRVDQGTEVINVDTKAKSAAVASDTVKMKSGIETPAGKPGGATAGTANPGQAGGPPNPPANPPAALNVPLTCSWETTNYDFGTTPVQGKPANAVFNLTNNGTTAVTITAVQTSCGCTSPSYTKEPIKPGEKGTVTLTYDSKISGFFSKSAVVRLNDGQKYSLTIKGEVQKAQ